MSSSALVNKSDTYITTHLGLGDHILCNGLYRSIAKQSRRCFIPVRESNLQSLNDMLYDVINIELVSYPASFEKQLIESHVNYLTEQGVNILNLGYFGKNFMDFRRLRFDENFYDQANVPFRERWDGFYYPRNLAREDELFSNLGCNEGPYIFLHEDVSRNFTINRKYIDPTIRIIEPNPRVEASNFFNYRKVFENAQEIHVIESSFCAFIESLNLPLKKFAHRYARPEASGDYCHEFTYKSDWTVYLN